MTVFHRDDLKAAEPLTIIAVDDGVASLEPPEDGKPVKLAISELVVVKRFGEPIYPALEPFGSVQRGGGRPYHTVLDAENFHALQLLLFMYEGQIDCMYLDPPYNTGARDWKYNNDYVDANDGWRHSKWLSMMEKRLRLAKRLLKPDGVIVVMIDEHELHHLGVLIEQLFPGYLRYMVSIVINSRGSTGNRNFGVVEEQALFIVPDLGYDLVESREAYAPDLAGRAEPTVAEDLLARALHEAPELADRLLNADEPLTDRERELLETVAEGRGEPASTDGEDTVPGEYWRGAVRTGQGTSYRTQRRNQFYPLYIDEETKEIRRVGEPLLTTDDAGNLVAPSWEPVEGLVPIWPTDEEGRERVWCFEPGRMAREVTAGNIRVGQFNPRRSTYAVNVRRVRRTEQRYRELTVWWDPSYDAGSNGTNVLRNILGRSGAFPFPKSVYAVRDVLATIVGNRPEALILDLFAGSGTTYHATALLNAADGGERRTISVTNNEVDADQAATLRSDGLRPGDAEYDQHGILEAVTVPRVTAVTEGRRPAGTPIPGRHKWASRRPFADGFDENCAFFRLRHLDPDEVELGRQFEAIVPFLWLAAGAIGALPSAAGHASDLFVPAECPFAVLLAERGFAQLQQSLEERPDITNVWLVTDNERAFADMRAELRAGLHVGMLYRDYLRNFRINTRMDS